MRGIDNNVMGEFVTTRGCRRAVISMYIDGKALRYGDRDREMIRFDHCGEGVSVLERAYRKAASERQIVEEQLDQFVDGYVGC